MLAIIAGTELNDSLEFSYSSYLSSVGQGGRVVDLSVDYSALDGDDRIAIYSNGNHYHANFFVTLSGGAGNDNLAILDVSSGSVSGGEGSDEISSNTNATINGDAGDDYLVGHFGIFNGGDGNDLIYLSGGGLCDGGSGDDEIISVASNAVLIGGDGSDFIDSHGSHNSLYGGEGNDRMAALYQYSLLNGESGDDALSALAMFCSIDGQSGNDYITCDVSALWVDGGEGMDSFYVSGDFVSIYGGSGFDSFFIDYYVEGGRFFGGDGDDLIVGRGAISGDNLYDGGSGFDSFSFPFFNKDKFNVIQVESGIELRSSYLQYTGNESVITLSNIEMIYFKDFIFDLSQANYIPSTDGDDVVVGAEFVLMDINLHNGNDSLLGGSLQDTVVGGGGFDTIIGSAGADSLDGGDGGDVLDGGVGDDTILGGDGNDVIYAGDGNDVIDGGAGLGSNTILGGAGDDIIRALSPFVWPGNLIDAGEGDDTIVVSGQGGGVTLSGGNGADFFEIDLAHNTSHSVSGWANIIDFNVNEGDHVVLNFGIGDNPRIYAYDSIHGLALKYGLGVDMYELFFYGKSLDDYNSDWITINIATGDIGGNDSVLGGTNDDYLVGGMGDDTLDGGSGGADTLLGGEGHDEIIALADFVWPGHSIDGGADSDSITVSGLGGGVTMSGGDGIDVFKIDCTHDISSPIGGWSLILDFDPVTGEKIYLDLGGRVDPNPYVYDSLHGLGMIFGNGSERYELFIAGKNISEYNSDWLIYT